jgi:hypothetical protein
MTSTGAEPGADPTPGRTPGAVPVPPETPAQGSAAPPPPGWGPPPAGPAPDPGAGWPAPPAGHGPPPAAPPPYGPPTGPPLVGWPTPPPSTPRKRGALIAAVSAAVLLVIACCGLTARLLVHSAPGVTSQPASHGPLVPRTDDTPGATAEPDDADEAGQQRPQASAYPADHVDDLDRVCDDNVFYPDSPKRTGKAPHPVVLLVADGSGVRFQNGTYYFAEGLSKKVEQTWASNDPRKVQMVACLDKVGTGSKIRSCRYDKPKAETVTLWRARWRLRVYETATGRRLLDKAMAGDDQACPYTVLVYPDKKVYAEVSDRAVIAVLRNLVNR